jgi:LacI family transcriptional regulator
MQIIEKYNYLPDTTAKNLRRQKTKTAALVFSSLPDSYVIGILNSVGNRARELGYNLLFVDTNENHEYEKEMVQLLSSNMVDGIIISPTSSNNIYPILMKQQFPVVLVNRYDPKYDIPRVTADDYQAGYDATFHLIQHGHKHIGLIYAVPGVNTTNNRIAGYKAALQELGLPFEEDYLELGHATVDGGFAAARLLLNRQKNISAIFILNDLMTVGCIKALNSLSIKCPEDVALIGFCDFEAASITDPPITTVSLPPETIGRTAFDVLMNKINNPDYSKSIQLPTSLIIRKSCGC